MFERILAATDFSELGNAAAWRAADLARRHGGEVSCVHATMRESAMRNVLRDVPDDLVDAFRAGAREQAEALARELRAVAGRPVAVECRPGTPHHVITEAAEDFDADLVVAGAHGQGVLQQVFLGGTISRVMAGTVCPLLIVRKAGRQPYSNVFAAVDLGERSSQVLDGALAMTLHGVTALHVAQVPREFRLRQAGVSQETLDRLAREHEARQEAKLAMLVRGHRDAARLQGRLATGHPNSAILETLGSAQASLLVIGRHAGGRLAERVLGSVPKFLAYHAPCDLLLV